MCNVFFFVFIFSQDHLQKNQQLLFVIVSCRFSSESELNEMKFSLFFHSNMLNFYTNHCTRMFSSRNSLVVNHNGWIERAFKMCVSHPMGKMIFSITHKSHTHMRLAFLHCSVYSICLPFALCSFFMHLFIGLYFFTEKKIIIIESRKMHS